MANPFKNHTHSKKGRLPAQQTFLERHLSAFGSFASIVALLLSLLPTGIILFNSEQISIDYTVLIMSLMAIICVLISMFLFFNFHYAQRISRASELSAASEAILFESEQNELRLQNGSKVLHNILHYNRYILRLISDANYRFATNTDAPDEKESLKTLEDFNKFLLLLTDNIKFFMDSMSEDDTACSTKILKEFNSAPKIKTFFRDSASQRERRENDFLVNGDPRVYPASDNKAFTLILNKTNHRTVYACNDLWREFKNKEYYNSNHQWNSYYNACIVVPISIIPEKGKLNDRLVLGFLCVDNTKGNLTSQPIEDYLSGLGYLLGNLFLAFSEFAGNMSQRGIEHATIKTFNDWG